GAAYHLSHVSTRERLYAHNPVFGHGSTHHPGARHRTVNQRLRQPWLRYQERRYGRRSNRALPGQHCPSHQPGWYDVCVQPRGRRAGGVFYLAPGIVSSKNEAFLIPHFGYNRALGNGHSFGLSVFANGGMNTEYSGENGGTFGAGKTGVNLEQLFIAPTWSWEFTDGQALGISPLIAYQRFEADGLGSFAGFSSNPNALTNNGTDEAWGYGLQIGWQGEITDTLRAGLNFRTILEMEEFNEYEGLFAEQGGFDIPQMLNAGIAWSGLENHWLLLDVQHIRYSEINSIGNPMMPNLMQAGLADDQGAGFGWDDMTIVKLGWQWQQSNEQTWRAGVSYGEQPIPDEEVLYNVLAPGVQEWHFTGGLTHRFSEALEVSGMAFYSPRKTVRGENPMGPGQHIELSMSQVGASLSVGYQ